VRDLDRDGRAELVLFARDGRVRTWRPAAKAGEPELAGELALDDPRHCVVDFLEWGGATHLAALTPRGAFAYRAGPGGAIASEPVTLSPRCRFVLRTGAPALSRFVRDVNRDGLDDVTLPMADGCELWLARAAPGEPPSLSRVGKVSLDVTSAAAFEADDLSDELSSSFAVPALATEDVNGDGRPDLLVEDGERHAFHLQRADGSFPAAADVEVDLGRFRDPSASSEFRFGGSLSGGDRASLRSSDLDRDSIPDHVIAHGRKVWAFLGTREGPQFAAPSSILIAADDVTGVFLLALDDDERPDLVLIRVTLPTRAALVLGIFDEWDVPIGVAGYRNLGQGRFETTPKWKNELKLRLPSILGLLRNPAALIERFESIEKRFRVGVRGDFDGDRSSDVALATEDQRAVEVWLVGGGGAALRDEGERWLRELLFDEPNAVWTLERLFAGLSGLAERAIALQTGARPADLRIELRAATEGALSSLEATDFDGDGRDELLVRYASASNAGQEIFDAIAIRPASQEKR
jgi:hypothetical protein